MKKVFATIIFSGLLLGLGISSAHASFGVTPPYVKNRSLIRNSVFEQTITLVRGNPDHDLRAQIEWDVPEAGGWISIDRGNEFILPEGEQKVPMVVSITVPEDAEFKDYSGKLRIKTSPLERDRGSGVSIALGARIDMNFTVVDKEIYEFGVRRIKVLDLNEGHERAWLNFPGKINFLVTINNIGNVPVAPGKVTMDIKDRKTRDVLEHTENSNNLKKIEPFEEGEILVELPTFLPAGSYLAEYKIYDYEGTEVVQEGEINLSVLPYGTLSAAGYGFMGLPLFDKASIVTPITILLVFFLLFFREQIFGRFKRRA
ncbi:MAG: hypothetical protein R3251_02585 [Candidatus Spechtbacterales bacterium]|nr:hypothetical protein [Candidatus Spechtbacterales bacterium]